MPLFLTLTGLLISDIEYYNITYKENTLISNLFNFIWVILFSKNMVLMCGLAVLTILINVTREGKGSQHLIYPFFKDWYVY